LDELGVTAAGITSAEAERRILIGRQSRLAPTGAFNPLAEFFRQFRSPLILILLAAATLSIALGQTDEALIVYLILFGSMGLGYYQEHRAHNALAELERRIAIEAVVVRDGRPQTVPLSSVVPGDLLDLRAGSLVAADAIMVQATELYADEGALTGESFPAEKCAAIMDEGVVPANRVQMGTSIRSGQGLAIVTDTGSATEYGALRATLTRTEPETSFARGIRGFGLLMAQVVLVLVTIVLAVNVLLGRPVIESLLFAAALAIGISPELLPAIVTVSMSRGARDLSLKGVLVRRLVAIESLGSMNLLCVDKTGTITTGSLALARTVDVAGNDSPEPLKWAALNARLQSTTPNPIDAAIIAGSADDVAGHYRKLSEIAYDFERKRLSIIVDGPEGRTLICKGAASPILADTVTHLAIGGRSQPLTEEARATQEQQLAIWGAQGLRVLAVAIRSGFDGLPLPRGETGLTLVGYLLLADPLKPGISEAVNTLRRAGIDLAIISGDSRYVVQHVAESIGIKSRVVTGLDLSGLNDRALARRIRGKSIFAEIGPDQKERIVAALRHGGNTVGFLGDGINDAPALRAADVGISVDNAEDVARAAADVILLQRDLVVLMDGVTTGRRTFANTIKYITITISANLGNMLSMAVASIFLPFLPLTASQVLLNNLLSDLPMLAISTDRVDEPMLARPWRWDLRSMFRSMLAFGVLSSLFDGLTFVTLLGLFRSNATTFQSSWFVVSLLTELTVIIVMRTGHLFFRQAPSRLLMITIALIAAFGVSLPYTPLGGLVGISALPGAVMAAMLAIVGAYCLATELLKRRVSPFGPGPAPHASRARAIVGNRAA
jgi:Mg2+-importing ATPase